MRVEIQAQIERLMNLAVTFERVYGDGTDVARFRDIADNLEAAIRPQWVPVAERLPDSSRDVFVLFADKSTMTAVYSGVWKDGGGWCLIGTVTHWHEIEYPEPPESSQ